MQKKSYYKRLKKYLSRFSNTRITKSGLLFFLFTLLIGAVAINSGNNLVYLTFTTILSFFVLSGLLSYFNLKGFKVSFLFSDSIFAKSHTYIITHIKNSSFTPKLAVNIKTHLFEKNFEYIEEKGESSKKVEVSFPKRGRFILNSFTLRSSFPFAFFERKKEVHSKLSFIVFPAIRSVRIKGKGNENGEYNTQGKGKGNEFFSLREYRQGENIRNIHWKTSAHLNKLMIIENEKEASQKFILFIDNSRYRYKDVDEFEEAVTRIASLAYKLIHQDKDVSLMSERNFSFGHSNVHLKDILTFLSLIELKEKLPLAPPANSYSYKDIIYEKASNH